MKRLACILTIVIFLFCMGTAAFSMAETDEQPGSYPDWTGKKWAAIGDSHTENNFRAAKTYVNYIQEDTGITAVNLGKSGMGWMRKGGFYKLVYLVPADADVVTFYGSFNDLSSKRLLGAVTDTDLNTIAGCVNKALDLVSERVPDAKVGIITPCPWEQFTPITGRTAEKGRPMDESDRAIAYCQLLCEICEARGIPCLDLFHCSGLEPWKAEVRKALYTRDSGNGCHPDENGHKLIAPLFLDFIKQLMDN